MTRADTVTTSSTGTFSKASLLVAYVIANTPHVLNAAPSPHLDNRPSTALPVHGKCPSTEPTTSSRDRAPSGTRVFRPPRDGRRSRPPRAPDSAGTRSAIRMPGTARRRRATAMLRRRRYRARVPARARSGGCFRTAPACDRCGLRYVRRRHRRSDGPGTRPRTWRTPAWCRRTNSGRGRTAG